MILNRLPDTVTIYRAGSTTDEYGNRIKAVDPTVFAHVQGFLQPERGTGGESATSERNSITTYFRLYLNKGTSISARDHVSIGGTTYSVEGDPIEARGLNGVSHVQVRLRKLEG